MKKNIFTLILLIFSVSLVFSQSIVKTKIFTTPSGATIYVDGSYIGQTPTEFRFRAGKTYRIELKKNNYRSEVFNYRGGSGNINKRLETLAPPAKHKKTPHKMKSPSYEQPQHHRKEHHKQNFHKPGRPHKPEPPRHKRKHTLIIKSDVPRAAVSIDRRYVGTTPLRIELENGMHDVFVNLPGHRDYRERVDLSRDKEIFIRFR